MSSSGQRVIDRLRTEQHIDDEGYQRAIHHAQTAGVRLEDALVAVGAISEADLLRYMAGLYRTRFVSTRKLAKATIAPQTLNLIPKRLAQRLMVFPVLLDRRTQTLSVVAADLEAHDVAKQVQMASHVRAVKVYVAMPGAIQSAIEKHYDKNPDAFSGPEGGSGLLAIGMAGSGGSYGGPATDDMSGFNVLDDDFMGPATTPGHAPPGRARSPVPPRPPAAQPPPAPTFTIEAPDIVAGLQGEGDAAGRGELGWDTYLETLNVLVALLEQGRGELRGHSSQVARGCRKVCERLGLPEEELRGVLAAAYLHDIGKASTYHLTALNVGQYEGHRVQAQKTFQTPLRMFEGVDLPDAAIKTLNHMYERSDGKGFPDRLKGKDIPRGARILSIVETYFDLTTHAKNPFRRKLSAKEACDALDRYRDQFFDGNLVDVLARVVLGDDLKQRLLADRRTVLLVDPDPEETTVLEMRLMDHGFEVAIARNASDASQRLETGDVDIIITEVDLKPVDGFALVEQTRDKVDVPIIFLTRRGDRASVTKGFELGAADYLVKPASVDVVAAKARQILDGGRRKEGGRGVTGSLTEMSLPDVIQILANGRKTGRLTVRSGGKSGEVHFGEGAIYDARFGSLQAEEGFYAILVLEDGDFELDPAFRPERRVIHASTESLLLEGMRRLDEGRA